MKKQGDVHRFTVWDGLTYFLLILLLLLCVAPFYAMFINATHDNATINSSFQLLPGARLAQNWEKMSAMMDVRQGLLNSLIIAAATTLGGIYISGLTAYGFSKFHFKGNHALFWVLLATMMLPSQLGVIGVFQLMSSLRLLDNHLSLILPGFINASATYFIRQYVDGYLPDSLLESGRMDGCGELKIFNRIALPILMPALATQAIFMFVGSWNNFVSPLILLFSQRKFPLPLLVQQISGSMNRDMGPIYLGVSISVIPILGAFIFLSRRIIGGMTAGAVKG